MDSNDLLQYADLLYKAAIAKTRDTDEAEDLLQETYLHAFAAVAKGTDIQNPKAYLFSVPHNRFYLLLRAKYKMSVVYFDQLLSEPADESDDFDAIIQTEEAATIRRELAFLSYIYREVMVRYYMQNQSVDEIASALSIPKGTVLSRLAAGRENVKKGVETMEAYKNNSYNPEMLHIGINGRLGQNLDTIGIGGVVLFCFISNSAQCMEFTG